MGKVTDPAVNNNYKAINMDVRMIFIQIDLGL